MPIIANKDFDNYFLVANEPYNIQVNGQTVFEVFRGQYFKWTNKYIPKGGSSCSTCTGEPMYIITGYSNCKDGFADAEGMPTTYQIPCYVFEETYDTEDEDGVCESWFHETGGYNKDVFTPPHLRTDEYEDWDAEKNING